MAKKLTRDDLKVQSFVTTLDRVESDELVGGTVLLTNCCTNRPICATDGTNCCDTSQQQCNTTDYTIQGATYQECGGCDSALYTDCCSSNYTECCSSPDVC